MPWTASLQSGCSIWSSVASRPEPSMSRWPAGSPGLSTASEQCPRPSRSAWPCRPCASARACARNAGGPCAARKPFAAIAGPGGGVPPSTRLHCSIVLDSGALMSLRVRCTSCRTAFLTPIDEPGATVECPKCGAQHRLPQPAEREETPEPQAPSSPASTPSGSVFVPSSESQTRSSRRRWFVGLAALAVVVLAGLAALVLWPRLKPRPIDPVERVAEEYLQSLIKGDETAQRRWSTIEEPPAIRSFQKIHRDRSRNRTVKGSFAPLARLHSRIESEFTYDPAIARFTPKNPLGAAGETLDAVHAAKEKAEKSGIYEKMASGDPNDIFDAAENFGKVFTRLAEGALAPKKILPTYKLLVDNARPPIPPFPPSRRNWPLTSPTTQRRGTRC